MPKTFLLFYSWLLEFTTEKYSPRLPVQIKKTLSNPWGRNWAEKFKAMDFFFYSELQLQEQQAQQSVPLPGKGTECQALA